MQPVNPYIIYIFLKALKSIFFKFVIGRDGSVFSRMDEFEMRFQCANFLTIRRFVQENKGAEPINKSLLNNYCKILLHDIFKLDILSLLLHELVTYRVIIIKFSLSTACKKETLLRMI